MRYQEIKLTEAVEQKLKHGSSKGHLGEYLLGAAVTAKFIKGDGLINTEDVRNVMKVTSANNLSYTFKAVNDLDEVEFVNIISNKKNIDDAKDWEATLSVMAAELDGAINFANSDKAAAMYSKSIATNGKPDSIQVKAAGEEDQSGTKADIFLMYKQPDGSYKKLKGWSLKTGSNLVGQASPKTFENMQVFFNELGITLTPIDNYDNNPAEHVKSVLKQVSDDLNAMTAGDNLQKETMLVKNLVNFMSEHVAKKDARVYIVNLSKGDYSAQSIRTMAKNLQTVDLASSLKMSGQPAVLVHRAGNPSDLLFQIRYTYSAPRINSKGKQTTERHRMFVETGPLFKTLGTISAKNIN